MTERTLTAGQARELDRVARKTYGVPTLLLMENAGAAVAREVAKAGILKKIAICCGPGNNGGDGFVCARHLLAAGLRADVYFLPPVRSGDARVNFQILRRIGIPVYEINERSLRRLSAYRLIVDALLGTGLSRNVTGILLKLIGTINASAARVVSVDIPSGLDATSGAVLGACVKASATVTFMAKKQGMAMGEGPRYCGKVSVRGLGVPLMGEER